MSFPSRSGAQAEQAFYSSGPSQAGIQPRLPIKTRRLGPNKKPHNFVRRNKMANQRMMTIAIEGCCHGELDNIYGTLQHLEKVEGRKIDLLISCGDFQAVRNLDDLETMACPPKYRAMNTFYKYYSGEKKAPYPTLFIGGNHEASNYMWELYHGGWAAPDIRYLGAAGCIKFGGLRIAGLSGIYKQGDYFRGRHEQLPYNNSTMRSTYHVRDFEVHRLMQIQEPLDIFISHDWPCNIARFGNTQDLLRRKSFLASEIASGELGSPANEQLLHTLRPAYWFAAHLHTKFPALVPHHDDNLNASGSSAAQARPGSSSGPAATNAARQDGPNGSREGGARDGPEASTSGRAAETANGGGGGARQGRGHPVTRFLALDKCLPGRDFLQVVELEARGPLEFEYDPEWLAIMRSTNDTINLRHQHRPLPGMGGMRSGPKEADKQFVEQLLEKRGSQAIPHNFRPTVPAYNPAAQGPKAKGRMPTQSIRNPQTVELLDMLQLPYNLDHNESAASYARGPSSGGGRGRGGGRGGGQFMGGHSVLPQPQGGPPPPPPPASANPEEIDLGSSDAEVEASGQPPPAASNPEEIDIGSDIDEVDEHGRSQGQEDPMFQPINL